jgi:geranylgeranyl transferase type-1 subunit beta
MLGNSSLINVTPSRRYLLNVTQHRIGGFSKAVGGPPDMYHSYLGLAALGTMGDNDLKEFDVGLCCSQETTRKIQKARDGLLKSTKGEMRTWRNDGFW